jgi:hypothetical protein
MMAHMLMSQLSAAQQSYQLNGQEMVFLLLLVAFVIGGWVSYEWIRKGRSA